METSDNPFYYLPEYYLKKKMRKISKNLVKIASGKGTQMDFEQNRAILLSLTEALKVKTQITEMNKLFQESEKPESQNIE